MRNSAPTPRSVLLSLARRILDPALSSRSGPRTRDSEHCPDSTTLLAAAPEHLEAICRLYEASFNWPAPRSALRRTVRLFPQLSLVAVRDGRVTGFALCRIRPRSFLRRGFHRSAFLVSMAIDTDSRGRGLGRALLGRLLEVATEDLGLAEMGLEVDRGNEPAVVLYTSMGFLPVSGLRGTTTPESVYMAKSLEGPRQLAAQ